MLTFSGELLLNMALMVSTALLHSILTYKADHGWRGLPLLLGVSFGLAAIAVMSFPVVLHDGVIFDTRVAILGNAALFLGPIPSALATAIASAYRLWLGGNGAWIGVLNIVLALFCGLALRSILRDDIRKVTILNLAALGAVMAGLGVLSFALLPISFLDYVMRQLAPGYFISVIMGTIVLGWLLQRFRMMRSVDAMLEEEEARFRSLFESSSAAILLMDVCKVLDILEKLRHQGRADPRSAILEEPTLLDQVVGALHVVDANPAALRLFGADSLAKLRAGFHHNWEPERVTSLIDSLVAKWEGRRIYNGRTKLRHRDGSVVPAAISYPIPQTRAEAAHLPVTLVDLRRLQEAEERLAAEKKRLDEILWGTDVGTWEWWIASGETRFNERWAEMLGYTLRDLEPISILTWTQLVHPDDLALSKELFGAVFRREKDHYSCEMRMRHRNGSWIWVLDRGKVTEWDGDGNPVRMSGTHADITKRKIAQLRLERIAAIRKAVTRAQLALMQVKAESALCQDVCDLLVEANDYRLAWICMPLRHNATSVHIVGKAGAGAAILPRTEIADTPDTPLPMVFQVMRQGEVCVARQASDAFPGQGGASPADHFGLQAAASIPVHSGNQVIAILNVCVDSADMLGEEEIALLGEFAGYLGLALRNQRNEKRAQWATDAFERSALSAVAAIAKTLEKRDPYTSGHQDRVSQLSVAIARKLGWQEDRIEGLRLGALVHDIGKIYVPSEILNRPGRLTENEMGIIRTHPGVGAEILSESDFPWPLKDMVEQHHERMDGSGYPKGLSGDAIIAEARIIAVADVVESIGSHRPYRPSLGIEAGLQEIQNGRGSKFDPEIVDACIAVIREDGFGYEPAGKAPPTPHLSPSS